MAYNHGVTTTEQPTSITAPVTADAGLPVYVGSAPINQIYTKAEVQAGKGLAPVLAMSFEDAVKKVGFSRQKDVYGNWVHDLSEAMYVQFGLYGVGPMILINVASEDQISNGSSEIAIEGGEVVIDDAEQSKLARAFLETVEVADYEEGVDYIVSFDQNGVFRFSLVDGGSIPGNATLTLTYDSFDALLEPTKFQVIGGVDTAGKKTGLEAVSEVFPRFGLVPGFICAPKFASDSDVAAIMQAKSQGINGVFYALSVTELAVDGDYSEAPQAKKDVNIMDPQQVCLFGNPTLGGDVYRFTPHFVGVAGRTDAEHDGIPYKSPSNETLQADGLINAYLDDPLFLGIDEAAYLNSQGIVTALNFIGGWKLWGNRTAAYPGNSDPKDSFIAVRRMMNWIRNTIVLTFWQRVDDPTNKVLVQNTTNVISLWMNGLTASGALLGGRVEFREEDNPITDLIDGIVRFRVFATPPGPARELAFIVEYDAAYLNTLFD